jgi:3'(2'), 5'-bisphosphate nucleotidase
VATDLEFLGNLAREAGRAILEVYDSEFEVERKEDHSPLTLADTRSHRIIVGALGESYPDIPVLSEEGKGVAFETRRSWSRFWLVDPLDGTKEFINRNGEFTVNIALIEKDQPTLGAVFIPVADLLYLADTRQGCWEIAKGQRRALRIRPPERDETVRILASRSHPSPGLDALLERLPKRETCNRGSSAKFCALASGQADFYPRLGPTWEWDTAAGHAVVVAAGGVVVDHGGAPLRYNKADLLNGSFFAAPSRAWLEQMGLLS